MKTYTSEHITGCAKALSEAAHSLQVIQVLKSLLWFPSSLPPVTPTSLHVSLYLSIIENRVFSHPVYSDHSFHSLQPSHFPPPHLFTLPGFTSSLSVSRKRQAHKTQQSNTTKTKCSKTRQKFSHRCWQGNSTGAKESPEQTKEPKTHLLLLGVPQRHQVNSQNIQAEGLVQTHAACRFGLCEPKCTLLSLFSGPCPGVFLPS